jgi:predicted house-cleaning noncanonical NTP pyrophosphatase (MazG superfamily)
MSTTLTFGQQLAFAGRTLGKGLNETLAKQGMEPATWYALITLSTYGPMPVDRLREELAQAPETAAIEDLTDLVSVSDGTVDLTAAGRERFETVRVAVQARTQKLLGQFDPADIETTRRVLEKLAEER